ITHQGISNYLANVPENQPIYQLNHKCRKFVSISTVSFIVFLREIFGTILNGLPVIFANDEESVDPTLLVKLFDKNDADGFGSTPTRLLEYLELDKIKDIVARCKIVIVGGEAFPPILYERLSEYTDAEIYNSYGPTEVTIASHYKLMDSPTVTAGWPMLNVVDKIMDIDGNQLPPYVPGEIYVGGAGIARGYINNPEQTKKVFTTINGIAYYNTGDLGKKDADGELYVQGRNDTQIKLRGLRIELMEIETAISEFKNITLTKVLVKKINGVEHLCAYYTSQNDIDEGELKEHLTTLLPKYMIPSYFTQLDAFPKTPNGKTDFKNLPDPEIDVEEYIAPKNKNEEEVAVIVEELLNTDNISINQDLFNLGLTSLSVIKVSTSIFKKLGVEISVMDIINAKNIGNIAKLIDESNEEENVAANDEYYELSPNQLGIYFDCIKNPEKLGYNLPKKIVFDKSIDAYKLKKAITEAIKLHPYLKNKIVIKEGNIYNKRDEDSDIDEIPIEFMDDFNENSLNDFIRAFDLIENQLFRFKIVVTPNNVILLADFHHILVDGTALNILFNNISALYDSNESRLVNETADAYEYIYGENKYNSSESAKDSENFFDEMMFDFDECTILTTNLNEKEDTAKVANLKVNVDKKTVDKLCDDKKISPNILFMSSTVLSLTKYVSDKNVLISTIFNGRDNPKYHNTIGMMVKTLPISFKTDRDMDIEEYFSSVNNSWMDVLNNSSFNYIEIANKYGLYPDFLYAFHGKIIEDINIGGKKYVRESMEYDSLRFKVALNIIEINDEYVISIDYNDALYSEDYISTFAESIKRVITEFNDKKEELSTTKIRDISLVEEKEASIEEIDVKFVQELFEKNVEENRDKIALICCDEQLTYDQLNKRANRVAHALINRGVKPGSKIIHMLPRTGDLIVAMLGILKAGCAFIPLANDYPEDRVKYIYENSDADWVISENNLKNSVNVKTLLNESNDESNPKISIKCDDLAYMIYTSGTTGKPKGVMVTNENVANLFANTDSNYV
ncbi:MAG: AMP-binding protein, partial [Methanosphaera sp.]|nr:AMP-binding protein [Methanosphaera sp.]